MTLDNTVPLGGLTTPRALSPDRNGYGSRRQTLDFSAIDFERRPRQRLVSAAASRRESTSPPVGGKGNGNGTLTPRPSLSRKSSQMSIYQLDQMILDDKMNMDTYGVAELRDGFFDALFLRPKPVAPEEVEQRSKAALPVEFDKGNPLSAKRFFPRQWNGIKSVVKKVITTRDGIKLLKSFVAVFAAYVLCLIPVVRQWLGNYDYIMVVSCIINHPGRTFGSQIDGAVFTILGTASGLAWGTIGLLISTSTIAASAGYGAILAIFLAMFMSSTAYIRSFFIRFYQASICAGMAAIFATVAETRSRDIEWLKIREYAIPFLLGQALALVVNIIFFPDTGNRALAFALNKSFVTMQEALIVPRPQNRRLRRRLAKAFMDMSLAYRDMRIDLTITRFHPTDVRELRNLVQGVVRALLSMETETSLFDDWDADAPIEITVEDGLASDSSDSDSEDLASIPDAEANRKIAKTLSGPTKELLFCMTDGMQRCHAALMDLSGCRSEFGPPADISSDVSVVQVRMRAALAAFDNAESTLLCSGGLPPSYAEQSEAVHLFVFTRHTREAASTIINLMEKVHEMYLHSNHRRINLPTYPPLKAIYRTNAQVRHDRGGVTAGMYQTTFAEITRLLEAIAYSEGDTLPRKGYDSVIFSRVSSRPTMDATENDAPHGTKKDKLGFRIWKILHRLQGFESKYALKVAILTSFLAVPAWIRKEQDWWNRYEAWWAVCIGWVMMHPRVGGNIQDFVTRALSAVLGAVWAGAAYAAGQGNPYVMGVFAAVYLLPMLYRFTQSAHPRSGLVGCLSFTVISLGLHNKSADESTALAVAHKGLVFFVGTTTPIVVNWVLWPFVARHELRKALSSMLFFMGIIYRNIVAKYVYFDEGRDPTPEDIRRSEQLESRLREGFVRIRQLLVMTRHELRLRAPFDPIPYSALAGACERFFEYLISVRQSALFYNPSFVRDNPAAAEKLLGPRRDAVAAILGNLYILAGALRSQRKVPRYIPSAAAARKKLLVKSTEVAEEMEEFGDLELELQRQKTWSDIYSYSYNESLTGCVAQLEELEKFTKLIVGEQAFDEFRDLEDSDSDDEAPNEQRLKFA